MYMRELEMSALHTACIGILLVKAMWRMMDYANILRTAAGFFSFALQHCKHCTISSTHKLKNL